MINTYNVSIVLDINDDQQTGLKRKASYQTLFDNRLVKELSTSWKIDYYQNIEGQYGNQITIPGVGSYIVNLRADNETLVDASQQGAYVAKKNGNKWINIQTGEEFTQAEIDANPNLYGEYDFFMLIAETQPSIINDLIRNAGDLASQANRF